MRALYHSSKPFYYTHIQEDLVEWRQVDLLDYLALEACFEGITQVYHCAAMVSYDPRLVAQMKEVNVLGTEHILNLCSFYSIEKLLFVSSIATLGFTLHDEWITEKNEFMLNSRTSQYAISKYDAEMLVWQRMAEGLNAVIVNPGIILGEGDRTKSSSHLFHIVQKEFPYYTQGGTGWVDAMDVAEVVYQLMNSGIRDEQFIVVAENRSFREVFTWIAQAFGVKPPHIKATPFMTSLVWRWNYLKSKFTGKTATITRETALAAQETHSYDHQKLRKALPDFQFRDLNTSIQRIVKSMKGSIPSVH